MEESAALAEIERVLARAPALVSALPALCVSILAHARARHVTVLLPGPGFLELVSAFDSRGRALRVPRSHAHPAGRAASSGRPRRFVLEREHGLAVPLAHARRFLGVLLLEGSVEGTPFAPADEAAAMALGRVLAKAVHARCERPWVADPPYEEPPSRSEIPTPPLSRHWRPSEEERARIAGLGTATDAVAIETLFGMTAASSPGPTCDAVDFLLAQRLLHAAGCARELLQRVRARWRRAWSRAPATGIPDAPVIFRDAFDFAWARAAARLRLDDAAAPLLGVVARFSGRWLAPAATLVLEPDGRATLDGCTGRWTAHENFLFRELGGIWTMGRARIDDNAVPPELVVTDPPDLPGFDLPEEKTTRYRLEL